MKEIRCKCCNRLLARVSKEEVKIELVCPKCGLRQLVKN